MPQGGSFTGNTDDVIELRVAAINANATYHNHGIPYRQRGSVRVHDGAEVTFAAGIEYLVAVDSELEFGWSNQAATVTAIGTAEAPIVFAGVFAEPGFWRGLQVRRNVTSNSRFEHVIIRDAGGGTASALDLQAAITLDHVRLEANNTGLYIDDQGLSPATTHVTVTGSTGVPVLVESEAILAVPTGGTYTGNTVDEIRVKGGSIEISGTISNVGVQYTMTGSVRVHQEAELTIEAGTEFVFGPDVEFEFGWSNQTAGIFAVGTADQPIIFRGRDPAPGWWRGLVIRPNVLSNSKLEHVQIGHAGPNNRGNLILHRPLSVTASHFYDSAGYGIQRTNADNSDYLSGNTFENNALGNVGTL